MYGILKVKNEKKKKKKVGGKNPNHYGLIVIFRLFARSL